MRFDLSHWATAYEVKLKQSNAKSGVLCRVLGRTNRLAPYTSSVATNHDISIDVDTGYHFSIHDEAIVDTAFKYDTGDAIIPPSLLAVVSSYIALKIEPFLTPFKEVTFWDLLDEVELTTSPGWPHSNIFKTKEEFFTNETVREMLDKETLENHYNYTHPFTSFAKKENIKVTKPARQVCGCSATMGYHLFPLVYQYTKDIAVKGVGLPFFLGTSFFGADWQVYVNRNKDCIAFLSTDFSFFDSTKSSQVQYARVERKMKYIPDKHKEKYYKLYEQTIKKIIVEPDGVVVATEHGEASGHLATAPDNSEDSWTLSVCVLTKWYTLKEIDDEIVFSIYGDDVVMGFKKKPRFQPLDFKERMQTFGMVIKCSDEFTKFEDTDFLSRKPLLYHGFYTPIMDRWKKLLQSAKAEEELNDPITRFSKLCGLRTLAVGTPAFSILDEQVKRQRYLLEPFYGSNPTYRGSVSTILHEDTILTRNAGIVPQSGKQPSDDNSFSDKELAAANIISKIIPTVLGKRKEYFHPDPIGVGFMKPDVAQPMPTVRAPMLRKPDPFNPSFIIMMVNRTYILGRNILGVAPVPTANLHPQNGRIWSINRQMYAQPDCKTDDLDIHKYPLFQVMSDRSMRAVDASHLVFYEHLPNVSDIERLNREYDSNPLYFMGMKDLVTVSNSSTANSKMSKREIEIRGVANLKKAQKKGGKPKQNQGKPGPSKPRETRKRPPRKPRQPAGNSLVASEKQDDNMQRAGAAALTKASLAPAEAEPIRYSNEGDLVAGTVPYSEQANVPLPFLKNVSFDTGNNFAVFYMKMTYISQYSYMGGGGLANDGTITYTSGASPASYSTMVTNAALMRMNSISVKLTNFTPKQYEGGRLYILQYQADTSAGLTAPPKVSTITTSPMAKLIPMANLTNVGKGSGDFEFVLNKQYMSQLDYQYPSWSGTAGSGQILAFVFIVPDVTGFTMVQGVNATFTLMYEVIPTTAAQVLFDTKSTRVGEAAVQKMENVVNTATSDLGGNQAPRPAGVPPAVDKIIKAADSLSGGLISKVDDFAAPLADAAESLFDGLFGDGQASSASFLKYKDCLYNLHVKYPQYVTENDYLNCINYFCGSAPKTNKHSNKHVSSVVRSKKCDVIFSIVMCQVHQHIPRCVSMQHRKWYPDIAVIPTYYVSSDNLGPNWAIVSEWLEYSGQPVASLASAKPKTPLRQILSVALNARIEGGPDPTIVYDDEKGEHSQVIVDEAIGTKLSVLISNSTHSKSDTPTVSSFESLVDRLAAVHSYE